MLTFHNTMTHAVVEAPNEASALPLEANWIDALNPTEAETALLKRIFGVEPPSLQRMSEIETSSRLYRIDDTLYVTIPLIDQSGEETGPMTPLGFVIGKDRLLTMRFKPIHACDHRNLGPPNGSRAIGGGIGAFITLMEAIVDHAADDLERLTGTLDKYSSNIFNDKSELPGRKGRRSGLRLRAMLGNLGRARTRTSQIGEVLLAVSRAVPYVGAEAADLIGSGDARVRLETLKRDAASLSDHEVHLADKVQFLLDATLGMIGVDQNDIFKVLTMVSVIGIPPTLIASMYGMNFKNIHEYDWPWGYQYGLTMLLISAIIPLIWFKWRNWW